MQPGQESAASPLHLRDRQTALIIASSPRGIKRSSPMSVWLLSMLLMTREGGSLNLRLRTGNEVETRRDKDGCILVYLSLFLPDVHMRGAMATE